VNQAYFLSTAFVNITNSEVHLVIFPSRCQSFKLPLVFKNCCMYDRKGTRPIHKYQLSIVNPHDRIML